MTISIIGCGDSAKEWYKTPCDLSIGVNDCLKFGYEVDYLLCVNHWTEFKPSKKNNFTDRFSTIKNSKPKKFITNAESEWKLWFKQAEIIHLKPFHKYAIGDNVYYSKTSPFVVLSYAATLNPKDIILFGVDMIDHRKYRQGTTEGNFEIREIMRLVEILQAKGINVWIGNKGTALKEYLPVYEKWKSEVANALKNPSGGKFWDKFLNDESKI